MGLRAQHDRLDDLGVLRGERIGCVHGQQMHVRNRRVREGEPEHEHQSVLDDPIELVPR